MVKDFPRSFPRAPAALLSRLSRVPFQSFRAPRRSPCTREGRKPRNRSACPALHLAGRAAFALWRSRLFVGTLPVPISRRAPVRPVVRPVAVRLHRAQMSRPASDKAARLRRLCEDVCNRTACPRPITRRVLRRRLS